MKAKAEGGYERLLGEGSRAQTPPPDRASSQLATPATLSVWKRGVVRRFFFVVLKLPAPYPHPGAGGEQPLVN